MPAKRWKGHGWMFQKEYTDLDVAVLLNYYLFIYLFIYSNIPIYSECKKVYSVTLHTYKE